MRMWMVDPKLLCNKHLLGEHVELHMFVGTIKKNKSLKGYINHKLVEVQNIQKRHLDLVSEMKRRGMVHKSEIQDFKSDIISHVDVKENMKTLARRCEKCRENFKKENIDV